MLEHAELTRVEGPYFFMAATLHRCDDEKKESIANSLLGTIVSSLHKLKDSDNRDGAFFIFPDLSVKVEGKCFLVFTLYQMRPATAECQKLASVASQPFTCFTAKDFPGLRESTFLTRSFSDQGVRLRLRKDSRSMTTRKRTANAAEFSRSQSDRPGQRANSTEETTSPYGAQHGYGFEQGHQNYGYDDGMNKRQRMYREDMVSGYGQELPQYTPRQGYAPNMAMSASMAPVGRPLQASQPLHYSQSPLPRLDTQTQQPLGQHPGVSSAMYSSPSTRQSPHYPPYSQIQASPATTAAYHPVSAPVQTAYPHGGSPHGGDFSSKPHPTALYTNHPSVDASSPRTHPLTNATITPSSSSSPSDTNYTASGSMGGHNPNQPGAYTYATPPGDHTSQLPPPNSMLTGRNPGMMPGMENFAGGLNLGFGEDNTSQS